MCERNCIKVVSAEIVTGTLVLTTNLTNKIIRNGKRNVICICTDLPSSASVVPVEITINGVNIPMQDVLGNTLQSDQLASRCAFPGIWGTNPLHFKLCSCTDRSQATARTVTPGATAVTEEL
jgi:hypothetical protein